MAQPLEFAKMEQRVGKDNSDDRATTIDEFEGRRAGCIFSTLAIQRGDLAMQKGRFAEFAFGAFTVVLM